MISSMLIDPKTVGAGGGRPPREDFSLEAPVTFPCVRKLYLENRIMDPVTVLAAISGLGRLPCAAYVMS